MFQEIWKYGVFAAGFTGICGQILLLRLFETLYGGSEMSVGVFFLTWLTAGGMGAGIARRIRRNNIFKVVLLMQAVIFGLTLYLGRMPEMFWFPGAGISPGLLHMLTGGLIILPFSFITGILFTLGVGLSGTHGGKVYYYEAAGAAAGGLMAALSLGNITAFHFVFIVLAVNSVVLSRRLLVQLSTVSAILIAGIWAAPVCSRMTIGNFLPESELTGYGESKYAEISVFRNEEQYSVFHNGVLSLSVPDLMTAEEAVHFPLLVLSNPQTVLLIGGGFSGTAGEVLKYESVRRLDYCEIDGKMIEILKEHLPAEYGKFMDDPRISVIVEDGRGYVKQCERKYDVVITALHDPTNGQLNRYYTLDYFEEVKDILSEDGVFSFGVKSSQTYISDAAAELIAGMKRTMERVFPAVTVIPGEICHFIGSIKEVDAGVESILRTLEERGIDTIFLSPYYLPDRLSEENYKYLNQRINTAKAEWLNRDFHPAGFLNVLIREEQQHHPRQAYLGRLLRETDPRWILPVPLMVILLIFSIARGDGRSKGIKTAVAIGGMSQMGVLLLLIWGFQAVFGYMYYQQAVLVTAFMIGGAGGAFWGYRSGDDKPPWAAGIAPRLTTNNENSRLAESRDRYFQDKRNKIHVFIGVQSFIVLIPIITVTVLFAIRGGGDFFGQILTITALFSGIIGGLHYSLGARLLEGDYQSSGGELYALDLLGAAAGAVAVSLMMIPLAGFLVTGLILSAMGIIPLGYLAVSGKLKV